MLKRFPFWIWGAIITQLLTAAIHSVSFFVTPKPENDTEKQLVDLMDSYKLDMGAGFHPSFGNMVTGLSLCFTFICLFAALLNWHLKKKKLDPAIWKGVLLIEIVIFGAMFVEMAVFTFLLPIVCTALIFIFVCGSYSTVTNK